MWAYEFVGELCNNNRKNTKGAFVIQWVLLLVYEARISISCQLYVPLCSTNFSYLIVHFKMKLFLTGDSSGGLVFLVLWLGNWFFNGTVAERTIFLSWYSIDWVAIICIIWSMWLLYKYVVGQPSENISEGINLG